MLTGPTSRGISDLMIVRPSTTRHRPASSRSLRRSAARATAATRHRRCMVFARRLVFALASHRATHVLRTRAVRRHSVSPLSSLAPSATSTSVFTLTARRPLCQIRAWTLCALLVPAAARHLKRASLSHALSMTVCPSRPLTRPALPPPKASQASTAHAHRRPAVPLAWSASPLTHTTELWPIR